MYKRLFGVLDSFEINSAASYLKEKSVSSAWIVAHAIKTWMWQGGIATNSVTKWLKVHAAANHCSKIIFKINWIVYRWNFSRNLLSIHRLLHRLLHCLLHRLLHRLPVNVPSHSAILRFSVTHILMAQCLLVFTSTRSVITREVTEYIE